MSRPAALTGAPPTLRDVCLYFLRLGTTGFGGPVALVGYMQRDLVDERRWFTAEEYREGLALAQLAPGPLAAQLAMYLGWVQGRAAGAALVGLAFVLPSFVMVIAIAVGVPALRGAALDAGRLLRDRRRGHRDHRAQRFKLTRLTLGRDGLLWAVFAASALVTAWTESEIVWVFVGAGVRWSCSRGCGRGPGWRPPSACCRRAVVGLGRPARGRGHALADRLVLHRGGRVRLRQRPRHRPVPPRRRGAGVPAGWTSASSSMRWRWR